MTISRVGTPAFVTQAGTSLSQSLTSAGDADLYFLVTQRGGSGSPTTVTYKSVTATAAGGLFQITGSARFGRWYRIARASAPAAGSGTMAVSWAGVDNIGVGLVEYRGDAGSLSVTSSTEANNASTPIILTLTALSGDVTLAGCTSNSASPAFTPTSGQTEFLESAWYSNTGHVIGELFGASLAIAWTASGSTCGGALVIHETIVDGAMVGDAAMPLAAAGTLTGAGALAGDASAALALAGALTGAGALSGDAVVALALSGALTGAGVLAGDAALPIVLTGALSGAGALAGDSPLPLVLSGTLSGAGALAGDSALALALSGALSGSGALTGDAPMQLALSGTLTALSPDALVGDASMPLALSGALLGAGTLAGDAPAALALSGSLTGSAAASGAATLPLVAQGTLTGSGALTGAAAMDLALSGTLTALPSLSGDASMGLVLSGTLTGLGSMAGEAGMSFALSGTLSGGATEPLRLTMILTERPQPVTLVSLTERDQPCTMTIEGEPMETTVGDEYFLDTMTIAASSGYSLIGSTASVTLWIGRLNSPQFAVTLADVDYVIDGATATLNPRIDPDEWGDLVLWETTEMRAQVTVTGATWGPETLEERPSILVRPRVTVTP
jgi:hypothetical protein